mmetsp:Transcript_55205/g.170987  ORF Transcript_55205/g.170987 Transcript_55205/m.170987 type:complete len:272 (-) Transcript_55205:82-897(-)
MIGATPLPVRGPLGASHICDIILSSIWGRELSGAEWKPLMPAVTHSLRSSTKGSSRAERAHLTRFSSCGRSKLLGGAGKPQRWHSSVSAEALSASSPRKRSSNASAAAASSRRTGTPWSSKCLARLAATSRSRSSCRASPSASRGFVVERAPPWEHARRSSPSGISNHTACCRSSAVRSSRWPLSGAGRPRDRSSRASCSRSISASWPKRVATRSQARTEPRCVVGTPRALKARSQRCSRRRSTSSCRPSSSLGGRAGLPTRWGGFSALEA